MDYHLSLSVNGSRFEYDVSARKFNYGKSVCGFESELYTNEEFLKNGYIISKFPILWNKLITQSITEYVRDIMESVTSSDLSNFTLEKYHTFVDDSLHRKVISKIQAKFLGLNGIHLKHLGIPYQELDGYINKQLGSQDMSCHYRRYGASLKHFWIRLIRPNSLDNNPPHKDAHLYRNTKSVNIYLPLAGSNNNSSLPVIPKSHLEKDDQYIISSFPYYVNGRKFSVPCTVYRKGGLDLVTPNPQLDEVMIFTPWLLHGAGVNTNKDTTRVSLEMRFFKPLNLFGL